MNGEDDLPEVPAQRKHDLAAKAVSNPVRKRILELLLEGKSIKEDITDVMVAEGILPDSSHFKYHVSFLLKAECLIQNGDSYTITKAGEVVKFM